MKKLIAGAAIIATGLGVAGTASAEPPDRTQDWTCDGNTVEIEVHGRVGIIDGVRYLAHNLVVSGTFDPSAPGAPNETFTDTQWTSGRTGGLDCTTVEVFTDEAGTSTVTLSLNAIPIGQP